jgi:cysteine desulfurase
MGIDLEEAASAIRVSLGWASTVDDVDRFVDAWSRLYVRTRRPATEPGRRETTRLLLPAGSRHK